MRCIVCSGSIRWYSDDIHCTMCIIWQYCSAFKSNFATSLLSSRLLRIAVWLDVWVDVWVVLSHELDNFAGWPSWMVVVESFNLNVAHFLLRGICVRLCLGKTVLLQQSLIWIMRSNAKKIGHNWRTMAGVHTADELMLSRWSMNIGGKKKQIQLWPF